MPQLSHEVPVIDDEAEENLADETFEEEALSDIDAILDAAAQAAGTGEEA